MRLPKKMAFRFISDRGCGRGSNPVSLVCRALHCEALEAGQNINGKTTNIWSYPPQADGGTVKIPVLLMPSQLKRWNARHSILQACQEVSKPVVTILRDALSRTTESERFKKLACALTAKGEIAVVAAWRKNPTKITVTKDGDILHPVARLPSHLRHALLIDGLPVVELDVKSAHAVLLGMFYHDESGLDWTAERVRYFAEAKAGFTALYGDQKEHKIDFLSALNQRVAAARHASHGYAELERLFPLLAAKLAWIRKERPKALGSILRSKLASIMSAAVLANHEAGIMSLPVTDSVLVALPGDDDETTVRECSRRISEPLASLTGIAPMIK